MNIYFRSAYIVILLFTLNACGSGRTPAAQNPQGPSSTFTSSSSSSVAVSIVSSSNSSSIGVSSTRSASSLSPALVANLSQKIDVYLAANQQTDAPGISVLVVKGGQIAYTGSKGMADIPAGIAISSHTGFRLASVSKPFTAIAIMQLVERGQLSVSDSLLTHIPELPMSWRNITIDQMLSHRSGIYDIINDGWRPSVINGMTNNSLITYLIQHPALEFEPGTQIDYSNTAYALLATIIERKTGVTFPDYMAHNVFGPANMNHSYINDQNQPLKSGDALNYARLRTYYGITTSLNGGMAQVSSIEDLFNFFDALVNGKLISQQTLAEMSQSRGTPRTGNIPIGYGFFIWNNYLMHQGDWDGFRTEMAIDPLTGTGWAILTNSGSTGLEHIGNIRRIILSNDTFKIPKEKLFQPIWLDH